MPLIMQQHSDAPRAGHTFPTETTSSNFVSFLAIGYHSSQDFFFFFPEFELSFIAFNSILQK